MFHRIEHTANYTRVDNGFLRDKAISLKARGLLATILSFSDAWVFSIAGLEAVLPDGRTAIKNAVKELEEHGYIVRHEQERGASGQMGQASWDIFEDPSLNPAFPGRRLGDASKVATAVRNSTTAVNCDDTESTQVATVGGFSDGGGRTRLITDISSAAVKSETRISSDGHVRTPAPAISSPDYQSNPDHHTDPGFIDSVTRVLERGNKVMSLNTGSNDRDAENLFKALEGGMGADDCIKAIEFCAATWSPEAREHLCFRTALNPEKVGGYAASWQPRHGKLVQGRIDRRPVSLEELPESIKCPGCGATVSERAPNGLFVCGTCNMAIGSRPS